MAVLVVNTCLNISCKLRRNVSFQNIPIFLSPSHFAEHLANANLIINFWPRAVAQLRGLRNEKENYSEGLHSLATFIPVFS